MPRSPDPWTLEIKIRAFRHPVLEGPIFLLAKKFGIAYHRAMINFKKLLLCLGLLSLSGCSSTGLDLNSLNRKAVLEPDSKLSLSIANFSTPLKMNPIQDGWFHKTFRLKNPMTISFGKKEGRSAIRLETKNSASMLVRHTDIKIQDYPNLKWLWRTDKTIKSSVDETTPKGDDSPARIYLQFSSAEGETRGLELIWARQLKRGHTKKTHGYFHYVVRGKGDNLNQWYEEEVNLLQLYKKYWPEDKGQPRLELFSFFCDSDDTGGSSSSYFADVIIKK